MVKSENVTRLALFYIYVLATVLSFAGFGHRFAGLLEWGGYSLLAALFMSLPRWITRGSTTGIEELPGEDGDGSRPESLRHRIAAYVDRRLSEEPRTFQRELTEAGSFNALVKKEIAAGKL